VHALVVEDPHAADVEGDARTLAVAGRRHLVGDVDRYRGEMNMSASVRPAAFAPASSSTTAAAIREDARKIGSQPSASLPVRRSSEG
jgi:hypothetical protein